MVSDKTIHNAVRIQKLYQTKSIRDILIFTLYQNYTLA